MTFPHVAHCDAEDPRPLLDAADLIERGMAVADVYATLSEQHKTLLFRVENRPPLPMLLSAENPVAVLRDCAAKLKDEA